MTHGLAGISLAALCGALLLPSGAAATGDALDAVLMSAAEAGTGWSVTLEAPSDPSRDPDLVSWGVQAQRARHYALAAGDAVRVCSIEIWEFASAEQARAARDNFRFPDWQFAREGDLLVMTRGLTRARGEPPRRGVFRACAELAQRVRARAADHSRAATSPPAPGPAATP